MKRTSSYCHLGNCCQVERVPSLGEGEGGGVIVSSTRAPDVELVFDDEEFSAFIAGVKDGEFDLAVLEVDAL